LKGAAGGGLAVAGTGGAAVGGGIEAGIGLSAMGCGGLTGRIVGSRGAAGDTDPTGRPWNGPGAAPAAGGR
jgi:hypothetical protein